MGSYPLPEAQTNICISATSSSFIDNTIASLISALNLNHQDWPLDCMQLLERFKESGYLDFDYVFVDLPSNFDAVSAYLDSHEVYLLQINRTKVNYPFTSSRDRRTNFTLAHELGHILLNHLLIPAEVKSHLDLENEEREADEFAGRLLMPADIVLACNFYSLHQVAAYFNVSRSALWTRLARMGRLDLMKKKVIPTCNRCGNTTFSDFAEFCGICGQELMGNLQGVRRIRHPEIIPMDMYKRFKRCPYCYADGDFISGDHCIRCRSTIFNYCSGFLTEDCSYAGAGNHRYCESCGRPTELNVKGVI